MFIFPNLAKTIDFIIKICTISSHHPSRNQQQRQTKVFSIRQQGPPPYRYAISPTNISRGTTIYYAKCAGSLQPSCSSSCPVWYQHCTVLPVSALSCLLPLCCPLQKLHHCGHVGCTARQPPRPPASAAQPLTSTKDQKFLQLYSG